MAKCPVCHIDNRDVKISSGFPGDDYGNIKNVDCPRCGRYKIYSGEFMSLLDDIDSYDVYFRSKISHWIRINQKETKELFLKKENIENLKSIELPKAKEQSDNLILWLGSKCKSPEEMYYDNSEYIAAIIGATDTDNVNYILDYLKNKGLIIYSGTTIYPNIGLTVEGWDEYDKLNNKGMKTKRAFMAMDFKDSEFNRIFQEHFKKAIKQTGFDLIRLDEQPEAGLIDNRLRVEIRNSRFLLSDLSHGNQGAYWEAGFAEGLGKPVIYLCEITAFNDENRKPHFDTNHHQIIVWYKGNLQKAEEDIKATIRNTLPLEAKMTDDEESEQS